MRVGDHELKARPHGLPLNLDLALGIGKVLVLPLVLHLGEEVTGVVRVVLVPSQEGVAEAARYRYEGMHGYGISNRPGHYDQHHSHYQQGSSAGKFAP